MKYFIVAGEASGDLHASNLMRELKKLDADADFCFLGGDLMQAQGGFMVRHFRQMAFMGFLNVLFNAPTVLKNLRDCKEAILTYSPDVLILVDYPSFNLRIARFVKEHLRQVPVCYYISPKIWAWKEFRIKQIKKYVDKMLCILPFETEFYAKHNYSVDYVGNPSVDSVAAFAPQYQSREAFCGANAFSDKPIIAILPGSRRQEIKQCLQPMLEAASSFASHQVVVAGAPGVQWAYYQSLLLDSEFHILFDQTYELLSHADVAIVNSGTATLETALLNIPQVVVYHVSGGRFASFLKDVFLRVKYISLVNLIADQMIVEELVAHRFTVSNLRKEVSCLLFDTQFRSQMLNGYHEMRKKLGAPGAALRAARDILNCSRCNQ